MVFLRKYAPIILLPLLLSLFIGKYVVSFYTIEGDSMCNSFCNGDFVLIDKLSKKYNTSSVIIFKQHGLTFVKRIVGSAGDVIEITNDTLLNDGAYLNYPHLTFNRSLKTSTFDHEVLIAYGQFWNIQNFGPLQVPFKGMSLTLDSVRINIYKSAIEHENNKHGFSYKDLLGTKYTFSEDYFFVLGDNRHFSTDSRQMGFIPKKSIIGTVSCKIYSSE